jgi:uncharacterized protein
MVWYLRYWSEQGDCRVKCPHCEKEVLIAIEYEQVEVDYCVVCKGIWLDIQEIELLLGGEEAAQAYLSIGSPCETPAGEAIRDCPECDKPMSKEATKGSPPVIFDHCKNGDGVWLDHNEFEYMLNQVSSETELTEVGNYLLDIFGSDKA